MWLSRPVELDGEQEEVVAVAGNEDAFLNRREAKPLVIGITATRDLVYAHRIESEVPRYLGRRGR
jgi:hypothetical protein